jgi:hypothetical protein
VYECFVTCFIFGYWISWVWLPRSDFSLHRVFTLSTNILSLLISAFKIFCCTRTHTCLFRSHILFSNWSVEWWWLLIVKLLVLLATFCWQDRYHVRLLLYTWLLFYSESLDGKGLNVTSISVTSIKKAISSFHEDSAHVGNFQFLGRFCTRLSIFILTFCSSIKLRWNWCRLKANKKSYKLTIWMAKTNIQTDQRPDGKWVRPDASQSLRNFEIPFQKRK